MKVLVVDDEVDIKTLFEQRFRKEIRSGEYAFDFVFSGEEALQYLNNHPEESLLILSDINMPGMTGLELLKQIKQNYTKPPQVVLMITAYADTDYFDQSMQNGAQDFLTKPLDFDSLKIKLKSVA